jgi:thioredoxin-dependent peroxiredoxin
VTTTHPEVGDKAPDFTLPNDRGESVSLSDFKGRHLVLFFYPRDDTESCTKEAIGFSEAKSKFAKAGADVVGISKDTVKSHAKFRDKHGLTVRLLSDADSDTCERYGTWVEKSMYGKIFMGIERSTFLIGPDGRIIADWRKLRVPGHVEYVLSVLREN